jgi:hypothetical protein
MTIAELRTACAESKGRAAERGSSDAYLVLVVPGERRGERARVLPGLLCRVVGTEMRETGPISIVDCKVADVERWLARHG